MPRARPASNPTSNKGTSIKRALSLEPKPISETLTPPSQRQSKRLKSSPLASKVTPKKSQYFEPSSPSTESEDIEAEASGYEDEDASASAISSPPESDSESEEYISSEEEVEKRKKRRKTGGGGGSTKKQVANSIIAKGVNAIVEKGKELWRPGVKADLAPGEEVFIKLPKARGDGGVKYKEGVIHPNTMLFLGDLKANNEREWLKVHDADYRQSKKDFDAFVEKMTEKLVEIDETVPELPPKDLVGIPFIHLLFENAYIKLKKGIQQTFRIYRDVRFSSDPTPYKVEIEQQTHFSAAWSRTGRKGPYAAYYLQISPGDSFFGGGLWCPEATPLAAMRNAIDRKSPKLKIVLMEPSMRKEFLGGIPKDEKKAVKAWVM
ncbi:MAG: hypothetical protein L6R41_000818 [Letrouitia leprolyta]|nr:MAG: hypothetical protein L6R41_000818 [Letrouitia leprolyta]